MGGCSKLIEGAGDRDVASLSVNCLVEIKIVERRFRWSSAALTKKIVEFRTRMWTGECKTDPNQAGIIGKLVKPNVQ